METYCQEIRKLQDTFDGLQIHRVIRWDNFAVDILAKIGFGRDPILNGVFLNSKKPPSVLKGGERGEARKNQAVVTQSLRKKLSWLSPPSGPRQLAQPQLPHRRHPITRSI